MKRLEACLRTATRRCSAQMAAMCAALALTKTTTHPLDLPHLYVLVRLILAPAFVSHGCCARSEGRSKAPALQDARALSQSDAAPPFFWLCALRRGRVDVQVWQWRE